MKKLILLLILCSFGYTQAQIVNVPDENFKAALLEASPDNIIASNLSGSYYKIDANDDGEIQESEALNTSSLIVYGRNINNLEGLQAFTNLLSLDCSSNNLTEIDLPKYKLNNSKG
ncbi:hypothetical protein ACFS5M_05590 [Lacinutrix iliipiscaria]|uniref:Uncharacterized protein n=1 Tax=Lacinutrix iliipiscaria TaxID=1230532 RepID=A0ABW5WMR7_9FLAO